MATTLNMHQLADAKGFTVGQLSTFGLRTGSGGVIIPYFDADGHEYIKYKVRTAATGKDAFRWSPGEAPVIPYGIHRPVPYTRKFVWIVEGESDCWTLWLNGLPALGIPGDTNTGSLKLAYVEDCTTIAVVQEHDPAGKRFPHRVAQRLYDEGFAGEVFRVELPFKDTRETALNCKTSKEFHDTLIVAYRNRILVPRATIALPNINVRALSMVVKEPVRWLWNMRVPSGKPCVVAGDGGEGKSFLMMGVAAALTTGAALPGGSITEPADVLIWNGEDTAEDTIRARGEMCGAALDRIHILDDVNEYGKRVPFTLRHINQLDEYLEGHPNIGLTVLDPITALLADIDGHTDTEVRGALQPLVEVARRRRIALVLIMHLKKSEGMKVLYRVSGSVAFGALGRSVMYLGTHAFNERKALDTIKYNLAPARPEPVEFRIDSQDGIIWVGLSHDLNAETIEASYIARRRSEKPTSAIDFLRGALANGPRDLDGVVAAASQRGINTDTLKRTKNSLGVISYRSGTGVGSRWMWRFPSVEEEERNARPGHLRVVPDPEPEPSTNGAYVRPQWAQEAIDKFFPEEKKETETATSPLPDPSLF